MTPYSLGGLGLAAILLAAYVILSLRRGHTLELGEAIELFIVTWGIPAGIKLIVLCVTRRSLAPFGEEDRVYIVIGGIALIWVLSARIVRIYRRIGE